MSPVQPPWDMTTPDTPQNVITVILGVALAGFVVAALLSWRNTGRPIFLLALVGGYLCSFNEALVDVLGHCFFPLDGRMGYTAYGRGVPIWVVFAYIIYFGGLPYLASVLMRRGISHRTLWAAVLAFWVADLLLEVPLLGSDLYIYYGYQPFSVGGFPLMWLTINTGGALLGGVLMARFVPRLRGWGVLLLLVIPFASDMASWVTNMPYFLINNTTLPNGAILAATVVCILIGLGEIDTLLRIGTGRFRPSWLAPARTDAPASSDAARHLTHA